MRKLTESAVKEMFRKKIAALPARPRGEDELMNSVFSLLKFAFAKGKGRQGTNSKTYTGPALEAISGYCVSAARSLVGLDGATINDDYIEDPGGQFDKLRLDLNVILEGKLILMQESRVWLDKPFATLKYQVIEDIVYLPHSRAKIDDDIIFPVVTICCDITQVTRQTREHFFNMVLKAAGLPQKTNYGMDRVNIFTLSAGRRSDGYFDAGMDKQSIEKYITMLINHFAHYKRKQA